MVFIQPFAIKNFERVKIASINDEEANKKLTHSHNSVFTVPVPVPQNLALQYQKYCGVK